MDDHPPDAVMSWFRGSNRSNPVWLLWVIWGATFAFIAFIVGSWFWLERPVHFERKDLYGVWESAGPNPSIVEFKRDGLAVVSNSPLPRSRDREHQADVYGEVSWDFYPDSKRPEVVVGNTARQGLYAENNWLSTSLVMYDGDPDQPGSRIVFTRTRGG